MTQRCLVFAYFPGRVTKISWWKTSGRGTLPTPPPSTCYATGFRHGSQIRPQLSAAGPTNRPQAKVIKTILIIKLSCDRPQVVRPSCGPNWLPSLMLPNEDTYMNLTFTLWTFPQLRMDLGHLQWFQTNVKMHLRDTSPLPFDILCPPFPGPLPSDSLILACKTTILHKKSDILYSVRRRNSDLHVVGRIAKNMVHAWSHNRVCAYVIECEA